MACTAWLWALHLLLAKSTGLWYLHTYIHLKQQVRHTELQLGRQGAPEEVVLALSLGLPHAGGVVEAPAGGADAAVHLPVVRDLAPSSPLVRAPALLLAHEALLAAREAAGALEAGRGAVGGDEHASQALGDGQGIAVAGAVHFGVPLGAVFGHGDAHVEGSHAGAVAGDQQACKQVCGV